jgi:hypothetical protein
VQSGGLGLASNEWEAAHGKGEGSSGTGYYVEYKDSQGFVVYAVTYNDAKPKRIEQLIRRWERQAIPLEQARAETKTLLPFDAVLIRSYTPRLQDTADLYRSEWLKAQFPSGPWSKGEPGDFTVLHQQTPDVRRGTVSTQIVIKTGNNP